MRAAIASLAALALAGCSLPTAFNTVIPKDSGSERAARGIAYGDDPRQRLDVYRPQGDAGPYPVVVFFYGGSWSSGSRGGYGYVGRALAARGIVAVIADYRLAPAHRYPAFVEDGAAAVRWARAHANEFGGDPEQIVLAGHSAGAYIAAALAVDEKWLGADRAAVKGLVGLAGPYDFAREDSPATIKAFPAGSRAEAISPITFAGAGDPPALLLTGAEDWVVNPYISEAFALALSNAGVTAEFRRYEGIGHIEIVTAIARPLRGAAPTLDDMTRFVERATARPVAP